MLDLEDTLPFGKHKGKQVAAVIAKDPGYVNWLRNEKLKGRENLLTEKADALLGRHPQGFKLSKRFTDEAAKKFEAAAEEAAKKAVDQARVKAEAQAAKAEAQEKQREKEAEQRRLLQEEREKSGWGEW